MPIEPQTFKLGIFFFIFMTASSSQNHVIVFIFQELHMTEVGPISLLFRYLSLALGTLIAPVLKLTLKKQFLAATIALILSFAFNLFVVVSHNSAFTWLVYVGFAIQGLGHGVILVSKGRYLHLVCQIKNIHTTRGQVFGTFQLMFCLSFLCGSLLTLFTLGYFSISVYFVCLACVGILSFIFCFCFIQQIEDIGRCQIQLYELSPRGNSKWQEHTIMELLVNELMHKKAQNYQILNKLKIIIGQFPVVYFILPFFILKAFTTGVRENLLMNLIPITYSRAQRFQIAGVCQILSAIGSIFGGYLASQLTDRFRAILVGRAILVLYSFNILLFVLTSHIQNLAMIYITCFASGFASYAILSYLLLVTSKHFGGRASVFSLTLLVFTLFLAVFQVVMIINHIHLSSNSLIVLAALSISTLCLLNKLESLPVSTIENIDEKISEL